ncbi:hypothetical protein [Nocardioides sp. LML1-1-1.1]|uniref:hypothetical protein n=1 Tax=Nocardioides sp. LML1-1-1.1 TaxID=3135248 RepID=UPI003427A00C
MDTATDTHAAALRALTRVSVASAVWLGLVGLLGLGYVATLGTSRDDQVRVVGLGVGSGFVLLAVVLLVALVRAGRRDLRAAPLVAGDRPELASGGPSAFYECYVPLTGVLLAVALVVFGVVLVPRAADGAAWGWITPVLMGVVAFSCGLAVRWRGNEYVGVHADGIRMVRRGVLTTAPWHRVLHFESGQVGIEGSPDRAGVSGELEERVRELAVAAGLATFEERLRAGESVDLGAVTLRPTALVVEGEPIRWDEIDTVTSEHDSENGWTHVVVRGRKRRQRAKAKESSIANFPVFEAALSTYTGLRFLDPR